MVRVHNDCWIALLLSLITIVQARNTCSEGDGFIACNTALCYFEEFQSCGVICTEGCSRALFTDSLVECLGRVGCGNASFQRSRVNCQTCESATFYFSAVTCNTRESCNDVNWASGNCCDGIGCPSTVPSCVGNVAELCSSRVLGFTVTEGGNPACAGAEQGTTAEPTKGPVSAPTGAPVRPPTGAPNPAPRTIPTQMPTLPPTTAPVTAPDTFRLVQGTVAGIRVLLRGVETLEANDILSFESTVAAWFEDYYAAGGAGVSGIEEMKTIISATSHMTKRDTALPSTELSFKLQVRYRTRNQTPLDLSDLVTDPFWDDLANTNLVNRLRLDGGSFAALLGPIGVPEFVGVHNQQEEDTSNNATPVDGSSSEMRGSNDGAPLGIYIAVAVLGAVVVLLIIGLIVFCIRNKRAGKTKTDASAIEKEHERGTSNSGSTMENMDPSSSEAPSRDSRTLGISSTSNRTDIEETPHATVVGVQPASKKNAHGLTYKFQTRNISTQEPHIATAEAIPVSSLQP